MGVRPAIGAPLIVYRCRRHLQFGDHLAGLALGSQLIRTAQLAHNVSRGVPLPSSSAAAVQLESLSFTGLVTLGVAYFGVLETD